MQIIKASVISGVLMKKFFLYIIPLLIFSTGCTGGAQPKSGQQDFSGTYTISNVNGLVIDIFGSYKDDDTPLILYSLHGGDNQMFVIERQEDLTYRITAKHSGMALTAKDEAVVQSEWKNNNSQKWQIKELRNGIVKFRNCMDNKVLGISKFIYDEEITLGVSRENNSPDQQFRLNKQ